MTTTAPLLTPPAARTILGLTLEQRNGLRWISGIARGPDGEGHGKTRLFPPTLEVREQLIERGLIEPHPDHAGEHRPTESGAQLLPEIYRAEEAAAERRRGAA